MNKLNIHDIESWLNFDKKTNEQMNMWFNEQGISRFTDLSFIIRDNSYQKLIETIRNDSTFEHDKRLEFKLIQLRKTINLFIRKWDTVEF